MSFEAKSVGGITVITLSVDALDASTVPEFKLEVESELDRASRVVLDFAAVDFIDSAGLGVIVSCLRRLKAREGALRLCGLRPPVRSMIELVRLHRIIDLHDTLAEALGSFPPAPHPSGA